MFVGLLQAALSLLLHEFILIRKGGEQNNA